MRWTVSCLYLSSLHSVGGKDPTGHLGVVVTRVLNPALRVPSGEMGALFGLRAGEMVAWVLLESWWERDAGDVCPDLHPPLRDESALLGP